MKALKEQCESVNLTNMNRICSNWNTAETSDCLAFVYFAAIQPCIKSILKSFFKLAEPERNDIFHAIWKKKLSNAYQTRTCLTQQKVVDLVWMPTYESCCNLVSVLTDQSMLLIEVENVFRGYELDDIQFCCESLVKSLASCSEENSADEKWIETVCKQIESYRLSKNCLESAKALVELRKQLKLTGDFTHIQLLIQVF